MKNVFRNWRSMGGRGGGSGDEFVPSYLEVKGFCSFEEKNTKGISRAVITDFVNKFKEYLDEEKKAWVGVPQIRGLKSFKFKVKVKPGHAWEIRELWTDFVSQHDVRLAGVVLYFIAGRSPEAHGSPQGFQPHRCLLWQVAKEDYVP